MPPCPSSSRSTMTGVSWAMPMLRHRRRTNHRFTLEDSVYVERTATHRRHQHSLKLSALIDRCAAAGYRQMVAVIADTERAASIGLHEKLGLRIVRTLPAVGFKFPPLDRRCRLMQRALPARAARPPHNASAQKSQRTKSRAVPEGTAQV